MTTTRSAAPRRLPGQFVSGSTSNTTAPACMSGGSVVLMIPPCCSTSPHRPFVPRPCDIDGIREPSAGFDLRQQHHLRAVFLPQRHRPHCTLTRIWKAANLDECLQRRPYQLVMLPPSIASLLHGPRVGTLSPTASAMPPGSFATRPRRPPRCLPTLPFGQGRPHDGIPSHFFSGHLQTSFGVNRAQHA